ncbi:MAG: IS110 family transposase, partial [Proteobacteria bacterium]|nr:IS110 family transposase [Pseudomonadota bacterium]
MTCNQASRRSTASRSDDGAVLASLELSCSSWLVTSLSPGMEKMSKHSIKGGDSAGLLQLLRLLRGKAEQRTGGSVGVVAIQEAGLDGFWLH